MRWLLRTLLALVVLLALYVGTAVISIKGLIEDAQRGDVASIMSRVDLARLRSSVADQIVRAHFKRVEQTRPLKAIERAAAPTIVDALVSKLFTPENVATLLRAGTLRVTEAAAGPETIMLPSLNSAGLESTMRILARLQPKTPVQLQVRLDERGEAAIRLHFEGTHWKLAGLDLPPAAIDKLIAAFQPR